MSARRFEVLDSWRGICAWLVVLFHFQSVSHTYELQIVRNAWLFVDFFFVLSGFVIAANYRERLHGGFGIGRFMLLRFGRLYPLHLFVLSWFVAFEVAQVLIPATSSMGGSSPFTGPQQSPGALLANVALVHSLGLFDVLTWNGPSWSISTEFYTYLVFAVVVATVRRRTWIPLALAALGGPVILALFSERGMKASYDLGLVRCLYGFAVGALCFQVWRRAEPALDGLRRRILVANCLEVSVVLATLLLVHFAQLGGVALAAPYLFAAVILVFSVESGGLSWILRTRPFLLCGALSYSIYMTHFFIQARLTNVAQLLESRFDVTLMTRVQQKSGGAGLLLGVEPWQGDLAVVGMGLIVFGASWVTYRTVEMPGRRWFRRIADPRLRAHSVSADGAGAPRSTRD